MLKTTEPLNATNKPTAVRLPRYAQVIRDLPPGDYPYTKLLPELRKSPALKRIAPDPVVRRLLLRQAQVLLCGDRGYAFVDVEVPRVVLSERYYHEGNDLDLYLDLVHELTHLRQIQQGFDLWDDRFAYVDRPTEVEAYAVAVAEGRRLGMSISDVRTHLDNPWMSASDVDRLLEHIENFLAFGSLPNLDAALTGATFVVRHPWRCPPATPLIRAAGRKR